MTRIAIFITALLVALISLPAVPAAQSALSDGTASIDSEPPERQAPPARTFTKETATSLGTILHGDLGATATQAAINAYIASVEAARIEAERIEAERLATQRAAATPSQSAPRSTPATVSSDGDCAGIDWIIPVYIVMRESRCNFQAVNQNGCGGWTCVGAFQFDLRHWIPRDQGGWGGCAHLGDWHIPANQLACVDQMSRGGTYLAPWGG